MIIYQEGATPWMEDMAHDILELLSTVYPGHPWAVKVYGDQKGGGYFIRHLDFPANFGMNNPRAHLCHSATEFRARVIRDAGELLERCNLARGRSNEDPIKKMEGVPDKHQPIEYRREVEGKRIEAVFEKAAEELRATPRPQALKEAANG